MNDRDPGISASLDPLAASAARKRPDWEDVIARASARGRRVTITVALAFAAALVVLTSALAVNRGLWHGLIGTPVDKAELAKENRAALMRVGAVGKHVDLAGHQANMARRARQFNKMLRNLGEIRLIAHRESTSFYVIEPKSAQGQRCFAIGRDGEPQPFGDILCPSKPEAEAFPSPRYPILDVSTIGADRENPSMRVLALEGFAADAVKGVGIRIGDKVEAETPVVNNVYVRTSGLPERGGEVVALDAGGAVIGCAAAQADPTSRCSRPREQNHPWAADATVRPTYPKIKPPAVQAKLDALNRGYDQCMQAHGSAHIDTGAGAWTYQHAPAAAAACKGALDAVDDYLNSPAYRASDELSHRLLKQFWACVERLAKPDDASVRRCADQASYPGKTSQK